MKKLTLIVAVASLAMVSCKKDRVCSCKDTYTTTDPKGVTTTTSDPEYNVTMVDVSRKTAFNACTHTKTKSEYTYPGLGTYKSEYDRYCEVK